jgi:hypothetical protein
VTAPEDESGPWLARPQETTEQSESTPSAGLHEVEAECRQVMTIADARARRGAALLRDEEALDQEEQRGVWGDRLPIWGAS